MRRAGKGQICPMLQCCLPCWALGGDWSSVAHGAGGCARGLGVDYSSDLVLLSWLPSFVFSAVSPGPRNLCISVLQSSSGRGLYP